MSGHEYVGTAKRTFKAAVVHLLETEYGVLGSHRVLDLLAHDLECLAEQFYPAPDHVASGWLVFTGTKASGSKAHPGKSASDYELVTLAWPVLLAEDLHQLATRPRGMEGRRAQATWLQQRLVRIVEYGWQLCWLLNPSIAIGEMFRAFLIRPAMQGVTNLRGHDCHATG